MIYGIVYHYFDVLLYLITYKLSEQLQSLLYMVDIR